MAGATKKKEFWLPDPKQVSQQIPRLRWSDLVDMAANIERLLHFMSADVMVFTRTWIEVTYNQAAVADIEHLYKDLVQDWLPSAEMPSPDEKKLGFAEVYKLTETDLQRFAVAIEQAEQDHKVKQDVSFKTVEHSIIQILHALRQHMHALRVRPNPVVKRDSMPDEQRQAKRPDTKIISRDYLSLRQLSKYAENRAKYFGWLKNHPELKPSNVGE